MRRFPTRFPRLETERLVLREIAEADAADMFAYRRDPEIARFTDAGPHLTPGESLQTIRFYAERWRRREGIRWGITLRGEDRLIGTCGFVLRTAWRAEIGYLLSRDRWRQGIMSEALTAVLDYGIEALELYRVEALVMRENVASAELLRKLGFRQEGLLREYEFFKGELQDMRLFSLLRREWLARETPPPPRA